MSALVLADRVEVVLDGGVLLAPVSFSLGAGASLAVRGANGSGKTTLLRVLAGLARPTGGSVSVAGARVDERRSGFRAVVAALVGVPPLARDLTLREHLVLVGVSWGAGVAAAEARADALLDRLALTRLARRFPHELSSGQVQLFTLALTLARPFQVLLLDEPEQRLDADRLALVGGVLRALVDAGTTLVLASHSGVLVDAVADEVLELTGEA